MEPGKVFIFAPNFSPDFLLHYRAPQSQQGGRNSQNMGAKNHPAPIPPPAISRAYPLTFGLGLLFFIAARVSLWS